MTWQNTPEKGNTFWLRLTLSLYHLMGKHLLKCLVVPVVIFWYWLFNPRIRHASRQYLNRVTPYLQAASSSPLSTYQHLLQYGHVFVDKLAGWLGDIPESSLQLHGHDLFRQHYGKGAIIVTSHFGNMELLRALKSQQQQVVNVLVYNKHTEHFNRLLQHINPQALVRLISVDELGVDTAIMLQERLDAGEWLMVAADRPPVRSERMTLAPFLGHECAWPQGAWLMAILLKCPVMAVFCYSHQHTQQVSIHLLAEATHIARHERVQHLRQLTQQYINLLEHHCSIAPYQWFNFYPFWDERRSHSQSDGEQHV